MKQYFAYIRVSTVRQGETGVSLQQQKDGIERYSQRNNLEISRWFEEQETAAKQGRPIFGEMIRLLRRGVAIGVIIHKIDRSARNLKDWADLGELIDGGIEVHFANEALDLTSRGGRLSADIQAVVAADYVRNLREEAKKGFYGRLKQGLFPMPAPRGYRDNGQGHVKTPDPEVAPLIRTAFELYATGRYNLETLGKEMYQRGLRRRDGSPLPKNRLSVLLNNEFYAGVIHIKTTGEYFAGIHQPLISKQLFDRVQYILQGKVNTRVLKHDFLYRRRLACKACGYSLIGELHKGCVYYRCHIHSCPTTCIREEVVTAEVLRTLSKLQMGPEERRYLREELETMRDERIKQTAEAMRSLGMRIAQIDARLSSLIDAYVDRLVEKELFEDRKKALLSERLSLEGQLKDWKSGKRDLSAELAKFLERASSAYLTYKIGLTDEKRDLLDALTSNRQVDRKTPMITLNLPYSEVAKRFETADGRPQRDIRLTWTQFLPRLATMLVGEDGLVRPGERAPVAA